MSYYELHVLQSFAPSNLNRDDTGSPKDCEFGGYRRARISSQCQKRAVRNYFRSSQLLKEDEIAVRTKRAAEMVAADLISRGQPEEQARAVARAAVRALGVTPDAKRPELTSYLLYVSSSELQALGEWAHENSQRLLAEPSSAEGQKKGKDAKGNKKESKFKAKLNGKRAADLALFGRMLADVPEDSIDAATQVAHALSTHQVSVEFDYYTAVDDRKPDDTAGADMVGTVEFNSACYYRYANVNRRVLEENLGDDQELTARALEAFLRGFVLSIPTGKQNSMAALNPPSFVLAVRRSSAPCNLANAFLRPVRARGSESLMDVSVRALDQYWSRLLQGFGQDGIEDAVAWNLDGTRLTSSLSTEDKFDQLVRRICDHTGTLQLQQEPAA